MPVKTRLAVAAMAVTMIIPLGAWAGGLTMYEVGTPDTGYAAAGYAARANDPGTILTNPAGMTRLKESQLLVGGHLLYGHGNFSPDPTTNVYGTDGGNAIGLLPALSAFGTYRASDDLTIGMGMFSNFGLGLWYDPNWAGRYYAKEAVLLGMSLMPAAAYRINDQLSLGVALNVMLGYMKTAVAVNNADPAWTDGQLDLQDSTVGIGANVGIIYEPVPGTRLGVTYTSPVKLDFSPTARFTNTAPALTDLLFRRGIYLSPINMDVTVPQGVMASFYHDINQRWAVLGNFGWQDWSEFGKVDVSVSNSRNPVEVTTNLKYKDTWHGALGAQYRVSEPWLATCGVAYDSGMMDDSNRSPALPLNWSWRFAVGSQYEWSKAVRVGMAYEYLYSGNPHIGKSGQLPVALGGRGDLSGNYPNSSIQFLSANLTWKF